MRDLFLGFFFVKLLILVLNPTTFKISSLNKCIIYLYSCCVADKDKLFFRSVKLEHPAAFYGFSKIVFLLQTQHPQFPLGIKLNCSLLILVSPLSLYSSTFSHTFMICDTTFKFLQLLQSCTSPLPLYIYRSTRSYSPRPKFSFVI